ncbi:MAG: hypothetical protein RLZZ371_1666 [Pseudomonadota bacterium]
MHEINLLENGRRLDARVGDGGLGLESPHQTERQFGQGIHALRLLVY